MTLEAAFIVPWVVFILVWIIYLGYFEYNRCLAFQENYLVATQAAGQIRDDAYKKSWINSHVGDTERNKFCGAKSFAMSGSVLGSEVEVNTKIRVNHPLSYHASLIPSTNWNISDRVSADNYSFTKRLRLQRSVRRVLTND